MPDESYCAGGRFAAFDAHQLDKLCDDHPMDDLQHWREQFGMHSKEAAQWDREQQHLLAHRHFGDDAIHQPCSGFRHGPSS